MLKAGPTGGRLRRPSSRRQQHDGTRLTGLTLQARSAAPYTSEADSPHWPVEHRERMFHHEQWVTVRRRRRGPIRQQYGDRGRLPFATT
jgi:hypothetical protein